MSRRMRSTRNELAALCLALLAWSCGRGAPASAVQAGISVAAGADDPIASLEAARKFRTTCTARGTDLRVYPGMLHEPLNEPEGTRVFADVARWLDQVVPEVRRIAP